jgi:hypothetical protein
MGRDLPKSRGRPTELSPSRTEADAQKSERRSLTFAHDSANSLLSICCLVYPDAVECVGKLELDATGHDMGVVEERVRLWARCKLSYSNDFV